MHHDHAIASPAEWPWLPTRDGGPTVQHPFCQDCGLIKSIASDRPLKAGSVVNLVADLANVFTATGRKVSEAQRRLIHRRLADLEVDDPFAHTRAGQLALLVDTFSRYTAIPHDVVVSHLQRLTPAPVTTQRG